MIEIKVVIDTGAGARWQYRAGAVPEDQLEGTLQHAAEEFRRSYKYADFYEREMERAAQLYQPEIAALQKIFPLAEITQTGGMCLAIEVQLTNDPDGPQLLITGADDSLDWDREGDQGWGIGYYPHGWSGEEGDNTEYLEIRDSSSTALCNAAKALAARNGFAEYF